MIKVISDLKWLKCLKNYYPRISRINKWVYSKKAVNVIPNTETSSAQVYFGIFNSNKINRFWNPELNSGQASSGWPFRFFTFLEWPHKYIIKILSLRLRGSARETFAIFALNEYIYFAKLRLKNKVFGYNSIAQHRAANKF